MKLRNKKTGEVGELMTENYEFDGFWVRTGGDNYPDYKDINYYSLSELNAEWEDVEEPKEHWYINYQGEVYVLDPNAVPEYSRNAKEIGNYFETKEEAEKAVEKLKAWQRLEDKGFRFKGWSGASGSNNQVVYCDFGKADVSLLNLLFGGEDE